MDKDRNIETTSSSEWFDATLVNEKPTRLSGIVFAFFIVILVFATIAYGGVDASSTGILSIFVGLITILWLADAFFKKQFSFNTNLLQLPILGVILIGFVQLLPFGDPSIPNDLLSIPVDNSLSLDSNTTRLALVQLVNLLLFFAAALVFVNTQGRLRKIVFAIIIFGSIMAFIGILQFLTGTTSIYGIRPSNQTLAFASFANRNHFAALLEMIIGLTLSLLYGESTKKDKRLLLIIAIVLLGIGIVLTGSRGGLLSLLGVVGFVTLFNLTNKQAKPFSDEDLEPKSKNKFLLIGASFALILILFGSVLFLGADSFLMRSTGLASQADVSTGRSHFWQVALQVIRDNPIIGTGLDTFGTAFTKYDTWNGNSRVEQAHNEYLQILSDAGILGFICVAAFIFLLFKQSLRMINQTSDRFRRAVAVGALAGCFGIIIHSFFDFPLRTPANFYFFLMFVVLATGTIHYPKLYRKRNLAV